MNRSVEARANPRIGHHVDRSPTRVPSITWPLIVAAGLMLLSVVLRLPTAFYTGEPNQIAFNNYIFQFLGAYSDITSLYFRDQLWNHPLPYVDYQVEYPVGMAALIWLIGFVNSSAWSYLLATAIVMVGSGLIIVLLARRFEGSNPWLLALSPTLIFYTVLNWDMISILLTVVALLLFRRDRNAWGGVALAAATWTKFFPIVLVPLVLLDRVLKRRWRDAFVIGGVWVAASVAINAPFAIEWSGGLRIRSSWRYFFEFNQQRTREVNLWNFFDGLGLTTDQINQLSALLLVAGIAAIMALMWLRSRRGPIQSDLLLPAALAAIGWFFFVNKVYSPQYSLWLAALLALLAAPTTLALTFAAVDVGYFVVSFVLLFLSSSQNPASSWFFDQVLLPATALREAIILILIGWACWRIFQSDPRRHAKAREASTT